MGINWNIENDQLSFKVELNEKPMTRRGMLSTIIKIYDPLGLAGPFLLNGKKILQDLCKKNYNWDEAVPDDSVTEWENWKKAEIIGKHENEQKLQTRRIWWNS